MQQLYDYILWVDIMTWQFWYGKDHSNDAEVQYQNEIFGLKLALSYVRKWSPAVDLWYCEQLATQVGIAQVRAQADFSTFTGILCFMVEASLVFFL